MLLYNLWLVLEYLSHGQQTEILQVLVSVLDEQPQLRDTELHGGRVVGDTHDHCGDALVEQGHGRGAVDEVGERLDQLLTKTRFQRGQRAKLRGKKNKITLDYRISKILCIASNLASFRDGIQRFLKPVKSCSHF